MIQLPGGTWLSAPSVIRGAVAAWTSPAPGDDRTWQSLLNGLNESELLPFIHHDPCPCDY